MSKCLKCKSDYYNDTYLFDNKCMDCWQEKTDEFDWISLTIIGIFITGVIALILWTR